MYKRQAIVRPIKKTRTTVTIPKTVNINGYTLKVTGIQNNAFKNNTKLKTINCGSNVKSIGSCAFMGCKNLKKVVIGAKVTTIGAKAFYKDKKLKTLTIKTTKLKKAGKSAFKAVSYTHLDVYKRQDYLSGCKCIYQRK